MRGHSAPTTFISSKPRAGINHKEYGVTSEGVNVYLDVALRESLGIDPTKDSFTIKMTGGPNGDVGGNIIKILIRDYGNNAKIVGIADHSGCAEDPNGLAHDELIRLVNGDFPIENFERSKLSLDGCVHDASTKEGINERNTMHNRLKADAFMPMGGRPNTIDMNNYKQFLTEDGSASSKLIVEGANLFITEDARQALFEEAGVIIVKDSSANKAGVITSSYEICSAMLISEEEFFEHKNAIVEEVLCKIRDLAKKEATLLFQEFSMYPGSLPSVSTVISDAINSSTDCLTTALNEMPEEKIDELMPLFRSHLPKTLADLSFEHVKERVPIQYIRNAIASCLASKMVYKEGTRFINCLPSDMIAEMALKYIEKEKEIIKLMKVVEEVDMPEKDKRELLDLLEKGGVRTALL